MGGIKDGPSNGDWAVFAERIVADRDRLFDALAQLRIELSEVDQQIAEAWEEGHQCCSSSGCTNPHRKP